MGLEIDPEQLFMNGAVLQSTYLPPHVLQMVGFEKALITVLGLSR